MNIYSVHQVPHIYISCISIWDS